jgi:hypothetical protein
MALQIRPNCEFGSGHPGSFSRVPFSQFFWAKRAHNRAVVPARFIPCRLIG